MLSRFTALTGLLVLFFKLYVLFVLGICVTGILAIASNIHMSLLCSAATCLLNELELRSGYPFSMSSVLSHFFFPAYDFFFPKKM